MENIKIHNCWVSSCIHCQCQVSVCANSYCGCELQSGGQTTPWQHFHLKNEMVRCEFEVSINKTRTIAKTLHSPILCLRCVEWRAQDGMASYVTMPFTGKVINLIKNVKICQNILGERESKSAKHTVTPFYVSFASKWGQQPVVVHHWLLNGGNKTICKQLIWTIDGDKVMDEVRTEHKNAIFLAFWCSVVVGRGHWCPHNVSVGGRARTSLGDWGQY